MKTNTVFVSLMLLALFFVSTPSAQAATFQRNLGVGAVGQDVRALQEALNTNPITAVSFLGSGAKGQETDYFGPLTQAAVVRFQELYRAEVLAPLGLFSGTGYVGPATRAKLEDIIAGISTSDSSVFNTPIIIAENLSEEATREAYLEASVALVVKAAQEQGYSSKQIDILEEAIREGVDEPPVATESDVPTITTMEELLDVVEDLSGDLNRGATYEDAFEGVSLGSRVRNMLVGLLGTMVHAQTNPLLLPFGGRVSTVTPCTCTLGTVWYMTIIGPRPGIFDYVLGTQGYLSYNLPLLDIQTLGLYTPSVPRVCYIGAPPSCFPPPSIGLITPITGSSLLPSS